MSSRKLTLADIADVRQYERQRPAFREHVVAIKALRRVQLGTLVTLVFENRDTMRFQIQEMARVEQIHTDEGIQAELDVYNPMVPEPGELCATMFIELTSDEQMREWLPKLVGIERSVVLRLSNGDEVRAITEAQHLTQLTRDEVTAAVHYIRFELAPAQIDAFAAGDVTVAIDHPAYLEETVLGPASVAELLSDLR
jgi:hypothetical protein